MTIDRQLFLFAGATRDSPEVDEWLSGEPAERYAIARKWFTVCRQCGADVGEVMHDGKPTACVNRAAFAYVNVFRSHVSVGFFTGAFLPDPAGLLQGKGKRMRHVKIRPGELIDEPALTRLVREAYRDVGRRLGTGSHSVP